MRVCIGCITLIAFLCACIAAYKVFFCSCIDDDFIDEFASEEDS